MIFIDQEYWWIVKVKYSFVFQVVGVPDERYGEVVCAWIRLHDSATDVTEEDIRNFCKGRVRGIWWIVKYTLNDYLSLSSCEITSDPNCNVQKNFTVNNLLDSNHISLERKKKRKIYSLIFFSYLIYLCRLHISKFHDIFYSKKKMSFR